MKNVFAAVCLLGLLSGELPGREFTGKNGRKIEAEIVSKTAGAVELRLESGETVTVPLSSLSKADQLFVEVWESPAEKEQQQDELRRVDVAKVLAAKGFVAFPVEIRGQFAVVKIRIEGKEAAFMFNHSVEEPVLLKSAAERLGLQVVPLEGGGGGNIVGSLSPERLGNGSGDIRGARLLVAAIDGIPEQVDGLIGGQFFTDREARVDFATKQLWLKGD